MNIRSYPEELVSYRKSSIGTFHSHQRLSWISGSVHTWPPGDSKVITTDSSQTSLLTDLAVGELAVHVVADAPLDLAYLAHPAQPQMIQVVTGLGGAPAPAHDVSNVFSRVSAMSPRFTILCWSQISSERPSTALGWHSCLCPPLLRTSLRHAVMPSHSSHQPIKCRGYKLQQCLLLELFIAQWKMYIYLVHFLWFVIFQ